MQSFAEYPKVEGNLTLTSNYLSEGVSSSNNHPAAQGNIQFFIPKGFYFNFWASSVDFESPDDNIAHTELEAMFGNTQQINDDFSYDFFVGRYEYPDAWDASYTETKLVLAYKYLSLVMDYSPEIFGFNAQGGYIEGDLDYPLFKWKQLDFHANGRLGHYQLEPEAGESDEYYYIGVDIIYKSVDLLLQYSDTFDDPKRRGSLYHHHWLATLNYAFG